MSAQLTVRFQNIYRRTQNVFPLIQLEYYFQTSIFVCSSGCYLSKQIYKNTKRMASYSICISLSSNERLKPVPLLAHLPVVVQNHSQIRQCIYPINAYKFYHTTSSRYIHYPRSLRFPLERGKFHPDIFLPIAGTLWNKLLKKCFPRCYNLDLFTFRVNRCVFYVSP